MKWVKKLKDAKAAFKPENHTVAEAMAILRANDVMVADFHVDVQPNQFPKVNMTFSIGPKSTDLDMLYEAFIGSKPFGFGKATKVGWKF